MESFFLLGGGSPAKGESKCFVDLTVQLSALFSKAFRKEACLSIGEGAVHQAEGLQGGNGLRPAGFELAGIRAVKGSEDVDTLHPDFSCIDHSPPAFPGECLVRVVVGKASLFAKKTKSDSTCFGIEFFAEGQDAVADHFRLGSPGRETPEQASVGIDLLRFLTRLIVLLKSC